VHIRRKACKVVFILVSFVFLSGCWDQREVEELAYVIAIGLDKGEDNDNRVRITYLISNPESGSTADGGGSEEPPREIISLEAEDFISSRNLANTVIAKQITYDLLRMIIISEDFARDESFIRWIYDATKSMEIKRDIKLVVTREETAQFLQNNKPLLETRPHEYYEKILATGEEIGTAPKSELNQFFRITEADADLFLGIYGSSKQGETIKSTDSPHQITAGEFEFEGETNTTQILGAAVFKEGQMIDTLTIEQTRIATLLNPTLKPGYFIGVLPDPFDEQHKIAIRIENTSPLKIKMKLNSGTPTIDVTVPLTIEVLSNHSMTDYPKDESKRNRLRDSIQENLNKDFNDFVKKTQEEYQSEPFGWSLLARRKFSTLSDWVEFDWMKTYADIKIQVDVQVKLGKFGRQSDLPSIEEIRD
jgi:spore germination protein KC